MNVFKCVFYGGILRKLKTVQEKNNFMKKYKFIGN